MNSLSEEATSKSKCWLPKLLTATRTKTWIVMVESTNATASKNIAPKTIVFGIRGTRTMERIAELMGAAIGAATATTTALASARTRVAFIRTVVAALPTPTILFAAGTPTVTLAKTMVVLGITLTGYAIWIANALMEMAEAIARGVDTVLTLVANAM